MATASRRGLREVKSRNLSFQDLGLLVNPASEGKGYAKGSGCHPTSTDNHGTACETVIISVDMVYWVEIRRVLEQLGPAEGPFRVDVIMWASRL